MKRYNWRNLSIRVTKPLMDLVIVITGVTAAFLLNSWNEEKKESAEGTKVINSLKAELHELDSLIPLIADYQSKKTTHWDSLREIHEVGDFYEYRFIQPQYNYAVIEYALNTRSSIVDFTLHQKLLALYRFIKMLEQAEVYMTDLALQYQPDEKTILSRNEFLFAKFVVFSKDRAFLLREVAKQADAILKILNTESEYVLDIG